MTMAAGPGGSDAENGVKMACRDRFHVTAQGGDDAASAGEGTGAMPGAPQPQESGGQEREDGLEIYGDSAYGSGEARAAYQAAGHDTVIKPKPKPVRPAVPGGFTLDFTIREQDGTVTCPAGHTRPMSGKRIVTFGALCGGCPLRARCTTAKDGRSMTIHPHEELLRAATTSAAWVVGARAVNWAAANAKLGPLRDQRIYYTGALPSKYSGTDCSKLPAAVWCIISYGTPTVNVASYVSSIPASRNAVIIFGHEPEHPGAFRNGAAFVTAFTAQSALIRHAAGKAANVRVAMASETYQYGGKGFGSRGLGCSFIPPAGDVDYYYADNYETTPTGKGLATDPKWLNWLNCVKNHGRRLGLAEYGLGTCNGTSKRVATLQADATYLRTRLPAITGFRTQLWSYFWSSRGTKSGSCNDGQFTDSATISAWRGIEAAA
jgi:hypothetical protein